MSDSYLIKAIIPVTEVFEKLNVAYYISGSVASSAYGMARATMDVDCVSNLSQEKVPLFIEMLKKDYYVDEEIVRHAIKESSSFNLIHFETMFKVDIFIMGKRPYEQGALDRRKVDSLDEGSDTPKVYLATSEDVILSKLEWFQKGGGVSEKQWADILGILKVQRERLDFSYLKHWAKELGLLELLTKAFSEVKIK